LNGNRCFILRGGIAPHRKQPETFSWTLTRFVEDKVAPSIPMSEKKKIFTRVKKEHSDSDRVPLPRIDGFFHKFLCGDYFSTGSFVVYGRGIASAILYATILKVGIYQYGNFLDGMVNMKSRYDMIKLLPRKILKAISGFFLNYGYISRLFRRRKTDPSDLTGPEVDLLDQDKLDQNKLETREEHSEDHDQEASHEDDAENKAEGQTEENSEDEEKKADDDTEVSPQEPEEERRRFEPPPFFLLDRVIASVDPIGVGSDISRNYKT
jgi:hypothetical protein